MASSTALWIFAHMASSSSMLIANKAAVTHFPPCSLIIYQAGVALLVLYVRAKNGTKMEALTLPLIRRWIPVSFLFVSMLVSSIYALKRTPIETIIVFRNLTALGVAAGDYAILKRPVSLSSVACILLMIVGAIQYGHWDAHFDGPGYFWAITNTIATCCYNLYTKWAITDLRMSTYGSTLYNNVLCLPFLLFAALITGEQASLAQSAAAVTPITGLVLFLSGFLGFAISFAGFKVQSLVSATSFTVVVNVSKIVSIITGMAIFATTPNMGSALGLLLSLTGAFLYAMVNRAPEQRKA